MKTIINMRKNTVGLHKQATKKNGRLFLGLITIFMSIILSACGSSGSKSSGSGGATGGGENEPTAAPAPTVEPTPNPAPAPAPTPQASPEPTASPTPEPAASPTPEPTPPVDKPTTFSPQPWDNGLTGLWEIEIADPSLIPVVQGILGLDNPVDLVAPGGSWLFVENNGKIQTTSCDTSAIIASTFNRVGQENKMDTDQFILNVPDGSAYDGVRGLVPPMVLTAEMTIVDNDSIDFVVNIVQPIPIVIPLSLTRVESSTLQIGKTSELKGGTACSYANGFDETDFDLHLTTFFENAFLRLKLNYMSLNDNSQSVEASMDSTSTDSNGVNQGTITFTDNSAPDIAFDLNLQSSFVGKVIIPDFTVNY